MLTLVYKNFKNPFKWMCIEPSVTFGYCRRVKRFVIVHLAMCWCNLKIGTLNFMLVGYPFLLLCTYMYSYRPRCWRLGKIQEIFVMITVSFYIFFLSRCSLCTVLLFDSTFHWSNQPSCEEQNVKERIHPKYTTSRTEY